MMDAVPWLFLLPPVTVAALAVGTLAYARSAPGRARRHLGDGGRAVYGGDLEEAERQFRAGLALAPRSAALLGALGAVLTTSERWDEALPLLEQACKADPRDLRLLVLSGRCHAGRSNDDDAIAAWSAIPAASGAYPDAQLLLADLHEARGRLDAALACLKCAAAQGSAVQARAVKKEILRLEKALDADVTPS